MAKLKIAIIVFIGLLITYGVWRSQVGIEYKKEYTPLDSAVIAFGPASDSSANLIGVHVNMTAKDYSSAEAFHQALYNYLFDANTKQLLNTKSIVVFPEYLGSWLVTLEEKPAVYEAATITEAMTWIVLRHPVDYIRYFINANGTVANTEAIFQLKAKQMAEVYQKTFSELASTFEVTVVAGSILLPDPYVDQAGNLQVQPGGKLYNAVAVFNPDGSLQQQLTKKIFPIDDEQGFVCAANVNALPVYETPAGKLGVLVCADSWYPAPYQVFQQKGVELLAVPSFSAGNGIWSKPWAGYNGAPMPSDVDKRDVGKLTEGEAWLKYAMAGRAHKAGIQYGVNVFFRGDLWDLGSDGETIVVGNDHIVQQSWVLKEKSASKEALVVAWIP